MNREINEVTNIGIPCYEALSLPLQDMTLSCSRNVSEGIKAEREIRQEANKRVSGVVGIRSMDKYQDVLSTINVFANNDSVSVFDLDEKQRLINCFRQLVELERTVSSAELKKSIKQYRDELVSLIRYIIANPYTTEFHNKLKQDFPHLYYGRHRGTDLRKYLRNEGFYYTYLMSAGSGIERVDYSDLFDFYSDKLEAEKLAMFLAYNYINDAWKSVNGYNFELAQDYLFYVAAYLNSDFSKRLSISINGSKVDYSYIKKKYCDILSVLKDVRGINLNRDVFVNKNIDDNKLIINNLLNMEQLKIDESFIKRGHSFTNDGTSGIIRSDSTVTADDLKKIKEVLDNRLYTYLKNNPIAQISCDKSFSDYYAFLYENGLITADRFKNVHSLNQLNEAAIYLFDAFNFEDRIKLTKQELKRYKIRKYHTLGWEDRITDIINQETDASLQEEGKKLLMRIKDNS